jgi:hypothetical protein
MNKRNNLSLAVLILGCLFISNINGLHFFLSEGKEKCFTDDIPANSLV